MNSAMQLTVNLPYGVLMALKDVANVQVQTQEGAIGILPNRLDCVIALSPGILRYQTAGHDGFIALDEGVLVKAGAKITVAVRHAIASNNLNQLQATVAEDYLKHSQAEHEIRAAQAKLEMGFVRRLASVQP